MTDKRGHLDRRLITGNVGGSLAKLAVKGYGVFSATDLETGGSD